ncbi:SURF1 family protein [Roseicella sp. DB1501]|uniref:SURF1 family protein n=1 Tax=Roseicella sp. DB1501 TaxID=2730925 RepID=UPI0026703179|nr:SURF1 family protein [Roseicella sp. DB1501]
MPRRSGAKRWRLTLLLALATALFMALGVWQVHRRSWKLDLIAAVDRRIHAAAEPAPSPAALAAGTAQALSYSRVRVSGTLLDDRAARVQAVTERGAGFWLLVPLRTDQGWIVLINRGFVPPGWHAAGVVGDVTITGLLRASEPGGGFLRGNDPAGDRWFSRDVAAIAAARHLDNVAPYFIDADAGPDPARYPIGGLTVVSFRNAHLIYAITWFGLAALGLAGIWILWTDHGEVG